VASWPVERAALGVANTSGVIGLAGDPNWVTRIASVGKLLVGYTALVAIEEGTIMLDEAVGPPGSTVRHLLAHASGQTDLRGTPAAMIHSSLGDLMRFGSELLSPTLIASQTLSAATTAHFPYLSGVVPGLGRFDPSLWGLTFEIKGAKTPHWTGTNNSPATFGHFGGSGTFLWLDPAAGLLAVGLTNRDYGDWAIEAWPPTSDAVLARFGSR